MNVNYSHSDLTINYLRARVWSDPQMSVVRQISKNIGLIRQTRTLSKRTRACATHDTGESCTDTLFLGSRKHQRIIYNFTVADSTVQARAPRVAVELDNHLSRCSIKNNIIQNKIRNWNSKHLIATYTICCRWFFVQSLKGLGHVLPIRTRACRGRRRGWVSTARARAFTPSHV